MSRRSLNFRKRFQGKDEATTLQNIIQGHSHAKHRSRLGGVWSSHQTAARSPINPSKAARLAATIHKKRR